MPNALDERLGRRFPNASVSGRKNKAELTVYRGRRPRRKEVDVARFA
eukprot:CAMPEP_0113294566 /NCGR_PEP_ID=MMETSP0008_2-20120614/35976_1 /TAXON_ID=97485 /ORGANISM="Prymnesium parvum" /LENGTH=46 /DNA_ID=CAMNT_0000147205 /DNA_START=685 /DNA_END=825 /DNA_ORIENTATION=+ /assembly_acc=CAM_ASM_000153